MDSTEPPRRAGVSLRAATVADASAIASVHEASRNAAYREDLPPEILHIMSMAERISRWQEWLGEPDAVTLVALEGGRIVGFGTLGPSTDDDTDPRRDVYRRDRRGPFLPENKGGHRPGPSYRLVPPPGLQRRLSLGKPRDVLRHQFLKTNHAGLQLGSWQGRRIGGNLGKLEREFPVRLPDERDHPGKYPCLLGVVDRVDHA